MHNSEKVVSYRTLLRLPGASRVLIASSLTRLSYGMIGLSLMLSVQRATGSFAVAGSASASFGICAMSTPLKSRLVDRFGQRRPLVVLGTGFSATLLVLVAFGVYRVRDTGLYVLVTATAGLLAPPMGPAIRAVWSGLTESVTTRQQAYSFDVVVEDTLFTAGPLIVGAIIALTSPTFALTVCALLMLLGCVVFARSAAVAAHDNRVLDSRRATFSATLRSSSFVALLAVVAAMSSTFGVDDVTVVARAVREGTPDAAWYLLASVALGGVLGGPLWNRRVKILSTSIQLGVLSFIMAVALSAMAIAPDLVSLSPALVVFGAALTPVLVTSYIAAERLSTRRDTTEASAWINTVFNAGIALGTVAGGFMIGDSASSEPLIFSAILTGMIGTLLLIRSR